MNTDSNIPADPWKLFAEWYALAKQSETAYPDAMALATVGVTGMPTVRTVLMKGYDANGLVFYTNRESRKGKELEVYSHAGVCFYWKSLQRQIRVEGSVSLVDDEESDAYFATRARASQIGAWASHQSQKLESRAALEQAAADIEKIYEGRRPIPRPPHWGGYRLAPTYFEFWQEREHRLHDRFAYSRAPDGKIWSIERLYP